MYLDGYLGKMQDSVKSFLIRDLLGISADVKSVAKHSENNGEYKWKLLTNILILIITPPLSIAPLLSAFN